mmetsp:Transcript_47398/g.83360  ORF Transcript_47398/g.83360 Transcript_47398/m.83360 type:complete len:207 (+) Transcript_47398:795-1415(+)
MRTADVYVVWKRQGELLCNLLWSQLRRSALCLAGLVGARCRSTARGADSAALGGTTCRYTGTGSGARRSIVNDILGAKFWTVSCIIVAASYSTNHSSCCRRDTSDSSVDDNVCCGCCLADDGSTKPHDRLCHLMTGVGLSVLLRRETDVVLTQLLTNQRGIGDDVSRGPWRMAEEEHPEPCLGNLEADVVAFYIRWVEHVPAMAQL